MKNRVNLQYSIYVDDLQDELYRLVDRGVKSANVASRGLQAWFKQIKEDPEGLISSESASEILRIREDLLDADYLLHDASRMISSYVSYKMEEITPPQVAGATEQQPATQTPTEQLNPMAGLHEALAQLPSGMANNEAPPNLEELAAKLEAFRDRTKGI